MTFEIFLLKPYQSLFYFIIVPNASFSQNRLFFYFSVRLRSHARPMLLFVVMQISSMHIFFLKAIVSFLFVCVEALDVAIISVSFRY